MNTLHQRLKELSKDNFESLIDQLLQARYPTANITRIDGSGGDRGVDSYCGKIGGQIVIWQDKHFPDGIGKTQKKQILESIEVAFENHQPVQWTLCVPIDLNVSEREWFEKMIVATYGSRSKIEVMQASNIVLHLLNYRRIREAFFPDALSDMASLKQMVMNTETISPATKAKLGVEYINQYMDALERKDERFRYEVTTGRPFNLPAPSTRPGLMASVFDGEKTIDIFARDYLALRDDPIRLLVRLSRDASDKLDKALKTGRATSFDRNDLLSVDLPKVITDIIGDAQLSQMNMQPSAGQQLKKIPMRVTCESSSQIVYEYVPFQVKYLGTEEVTLESTANLPIVLTVTLPLGEKKQCNIKLESRYEGFSFRSIQKAINFADALTGGGSFSMTNIETETELVKMAPSDAAIDSPIDEGLRQLIDDAIVVSNYLSTDLMFPQGDPSAEDYELLYVLKQLATGEEFEIIQMRFHMKKDSKISGQYEGLIQFGEGGLLRFESSSKEQLKVLFGMPINTGRMLLLVDHLKLEKWENTKHKYEKAREGEPVEIIALGPSKARYMRN